MRVGRYLAVLAGAGILAAGCGTKPAPTVGLAAAVNHTAGQTARVAVTTTMQSQGMSVSFTETGAFDFARYRGTFSMQQPVAMTVIYIPPKAYIKFPAGAGGPPLPGGKTWIAVDGGQPQGSLLGPFGGGDDPADLLASLTAVSSSVTNLGAGTVRGVPVTGFRVDIDPAKAAARVPDPERAGYLAYARMLGGGVIPVDVWVDQQNLVRRVTLALHLPGMTGPAGSSRVVLTTDFYDFGIPVRVSAPPAAEIAGESALSRSGSSASVGVPAPPAPPRVSGTLSPAQAAGAARVVAAFWTALGHGDPAAVARTVPAVQRACARSMLNGGPKITVAALRILSVQPAGNGRATVRFRVRAQVSVGGQKIPVFPQGPGRVQWLEVIQTAGRWYADLSGDSGFMFAGTCS